jgi:hypothetical protein
MQDKHVAQLNLFYVDANVDTGSSRSNEFAHPNNIYSSRQDTPKQSTSSSNTSQRSNSIPVEQKSINHSNGEKYNEQTNKCTFTNL